MDLALVEVHKSKEGFCEAELHRLRGELLRMHDSSNGAEAEACFRTAIEIAREQSAQSLELRATTSRARLLAKRDQRDEALLSLSL